MLLPLRQLRKGADQLHGFFVKLLVILNGCARPRRAGPTKPGPVFFSSIPRPARFSYSHEREF